jgi:hypothetical protein
VALTDLMGTSDAGPVGQPPPVRWIDRLDRRVVWVLTALGFGLPLGLVVWLVYHYGVNVVVGDQWDDVTVIQASYTHLFSWGALWAQHNENRIFFPNLVVVALSRTTGFNIRAEEALSAILLVASTSLVVLTHRRRAPDTPWLYYCPVAILMLSITQFGNMLWGFQMAWYLVLFFVTLSMFLLDRLTLGWWLFAAATAAALVASFSSLQGLLIWPVGLVLLYHRRRTWPFVASWVVVGVAATALYMHNYDSHMAAAPHSAAITHPVVSVKFIAVAIGDVLGIPFHYGQASDPWLILLGLLMMVVALGVALVYGIRRDDEGAGPFAVALIVLGLLFAATVTEGRVIFGAWAASASRYTTFDLLVPVGIYLALLGRPRMTVDAPGAAAASTGSDRIGWIQQRAVPAARVFIGLVIVQQVAVSIPNGIKGARDNYVYQAQAAQVLRNIRHTPDAQVVYFLYVFGHAPFIRRQAAILQRHHLSVFAGDPQAVGVPPAPSSLLAPSTQPIAVGGRGHPTLPVRRNDR